jgi:hypothetical protein
MAALSKVLASFEDRFGSQCVDIFVREDGTFGFEEFRGDSDGNGRWQSLGKYSQLSFNSGEETLLEANQRVVWLENTGPWRW